MNASTRHRVPAVVAALAVGGLLLAGCGSSATQSERGSQSFGPVTRVEIKADSGTVQVRSGPDGAATVDRDLRWGGEKPELTQEVQGDVLRVTARCRDEDRCETGLVVTVPAATATTAELGAGSVTVTGLSGTQDLSTGAGNVGGSGLGAAPTTARTSGGNVDLAFTAAPPTVDAESDAGNVDIRLPAEVYEVDASTTAGNTRIEVADTPGAPSKIRARSSAGNVSVLPG